MSLWSNTIRLRQSLCRLMLFLLYQKRPLGCCQCYGDSDFQTLVAAACSEISGGGIVMSSVLPSGATWLVFDSGDREFLGVDCGFIGIGRAQRTYGVAGVVAAMIFAYFSASQRQRDCDSSNAFRNTRRWLVARGIDDPALIALYQQQELPYEDA